MDMVKHPTKNKIKSFRFEITANTKKTIIDAGKAEMKVSHN